MTKPHETAVDRVSRKLRARGLSLHTVCDVDYSTPFHWNRSADVKNGRGGSIPDKYHPAILKAAKAAKAGVTAADLINT